MLFQDALGLYHNLNLKTGQETMVIIQVWTIFSVFTTQEARFSTVQPVHSMALVDSLVVLVNWWLIPLWRSPQISSFIFQTHLPFAYSGGKISVNHTNKHLKLLVIYEPSQTPANYSRQSNPAQDQRKQIHF